MILAICLCYNVARPLLQGTARTIVNPRIHMRVSPHCNRQRASEKLFYWNNLGSEIPKRGSISQRRIIEGLEKGLLISVTKLLNMASTLNRMGSQTAGESRNPFYLGLRTSTRLVQGMDPQGKRVLTPSRQTKIIENFINLRSEPPPPHFIKGRSVQRYDMPLCTGNSQQDSTEGQFFKKCTRIQILTTPLNSSFWKFWDVFWPILADFWVKSRFKLP